MANLPLVDTMHHALQAWCIFCGVPPDTPGQWGQAGQNAACFPGAFFPPYLFLSAGGNPSADSILDISWKYAKETHKNARARLLQQKTHELCCVYFECSYCLCHAKRKNQTTLLFASAASGFFVHSPANTSSKRCLQNQSLSRNIDSILWIFSKKYWFIALLRTQSSAAPKCDHCSWRW